MTDTSMNGMFEPDASGRVLDLEGATVEPGDTDRTDDEPAMETTAGPQQEQPG
jgi:hypothetical protein